LYDGERNKNTIVIFNYCTHGLNIDFFKDIV